MVIRLKIRQCWVFTTAEVIDGQLSTRAPILGGTRSSVVARHYVGFEVMLGMNLERFATWKPGDYVVISIAAGILFEKSMQLEGELELKTTRSNRMGK
jgi:hypothetical protein